jgi:hypothetical protein
LSGQVASASAVHPDVVKRALITAAFLLATTAAAQVTINITPPTPPRVTVTTQAPRPVSAQVVLSASISLFVPAGITIVSDTRTSDAAVIVIQPTPTYVISRPVYITTYERYSQDFRARGYVVVKSTINNGIARGEFRKGSERVTIISKPRAKGAEIRVQTTGGPKIKSIQVKAKGKNK